MDSAAGGRALLRAAALPVSEHVGWGLHPGRHIDSALERYLSGRAEHPCTVHRRRGTCRGRQRVNGSRAVV